MKRKKGELKIYTKSIENNIHFPLFNKEGLGEILKESEKKIMDVNPPLIKGEQKATKVYE